MTTCLRAPHRQATEQITAEIDDEIANPLEARRDAILAAFVEEPLTPAEAYQLIDELAEIEIQIERNN